jgi:hypothetical protein
MFKNAPGVFVEPEGSHQNLPFLIIQKTPRGVF